MIVNNSIFVPQKSRTGEKNDEPVVLSVVLSKIFNIREIEDVLFRVIYRLTAVHLLKKDRKGEL
jgi:hypothetical protein